MTKMTNAHSVPGHRQCIRPSTLHNTCSMNHNTLQNFPLEIDLQLKELAPKHLSATDTSKALTAALQSKRELHNFQPDRVFREYDKETGSNRLAPRPYLGLKSYGRTCVSLCIESAAEKQQHLTAGVWSSVSGSPYVSLGDVAALDVTLPDLSWCRTQTASRRK